MSIRINISNTQKKDSPNESNENSYSVLEEDLKIINKPKVLASNSNDLSKLEISRISPKNSYYNEDSISNINIESLAGKITQNNAIQEKEFEIDKNAVIRLSSPLEKEGKFLSDSVKKQPCSEFLKEGVINSDRNPKKYISNKNNLSNLTDILAEKSQNYHSMNKIVPSENNFVFSRIKINSTKQKMPPLNIAFILDGDKIKTEQETRIEKLNNKIISLNKSDENSTGNKKNSNSNSNSSNSTSVKRTGSPFT